MATYKVHNTQKSGAEFYINLDVVVDNHRFNQTIVTTKTGPELDAQLQAYADDYESALVVQTPAQD